MYFLQLPLARTYPMLHILHRFKETPFLFFRLGDLSFDANFRLRSSSIIRNRGSYITLDGPISKVALKQRWRESEQ